MNTEIDEPTKQLFEAVKNGNAAAVSDSIERGAQIDYKNVEGETALYLAVRAGRVDTASKLIELGADVNAKDNYGNTVLIRAALYGRGDIVSKLLEKGADVTAKNYAGKTALFMASLFKRLDFDVVLKHLGRVADVVEVSYVKLALCWAALFGRDYTVLKLVEFGADVNTKDEYGETALIRAARHGELDIVSKLLEFGADVNAEDNNGKTALYWAHHKRRLDIVTKLIEKGAIVDDKDKIGNEALIYAAERGHVDIVAKLLEFGADLEAKDYQGKTALIFAAERGHVDIVAKLLEFGADVTAKDKYGNTALISAASSGHLDVVSKLVELGADVNAKDKYGDTALISAASSGHLDVVSKLVELGADVNAKTAWRTALISAAQYGRVDIVSKLLEFGADVNAKNKWGKTAFDRARNKNIQVLLKAAEVLDKIILADSRSKDTVLTENTRVLEGVLNLSPDLLKANIEKIATVLLSRVHYQLLSEHKAKHLEKQANEFAQLANNNFSAIKDLLLKLKETYANNLSEEEKKQLDKTFSDADNIESNVNNINAKKALLTIVKDKLYLDSGLVGFRGASKAFSETLDQEITAVKASRDGEDQAQVADQALPYLNGLPLSLVYVFLSESNLSKTQKILEAKPELLVKAFKGAPLAIQEIVMKAITTELSLESKNYCPPSYKVKGLSKLKEEFTKIIKIQENISGIAISSEIHNDIAPSASASDAAHQTADLTDLIGINSSGNEI